MFGPISGAHLNPAVTLADAWCRVDCPTSARDTGIYRGTNSRSICRGCSGPCYVRPLSIHCWDARPHRLRSTSPSEFIATFGLLSVIWGCAKHRPSAVPFAVGAYITAAYWFTASTSFANPAVTIARAVSNTFAGIRPTDVGGFVAAQLAGAFLATLLFRWLIPSLKLAATAGFVQHDRT